MNPISDICIFCGASRPTNDRYVAAMRTLTDTMLKRDIGLVYGGGNVGLMGVAAEAIMAAGGRVLGVIPHQLEKREVAHLGLTELIVVDTMHQRKAIMYDRSDAFVVMPGGFGTLDEAMEILTWKQLGIHDKPIVFVNLEGYYDGLERLFTRAVGDGLLKPAYIPLAHFVSDIPALFTYLDVYQPSRAGLMNWG